LALWTPDEQKLVLAMDATSLKKLFVVLSISVVYRGCAIPIAWAILPEGQKGSWKEPWLRLFRCFHGSTPAGWLVIVTADRGLYARWLFEAIQGCGWHPFLRINLRSKYRPKGVTDFRPMAQLLPSPGSVWAGKVTCFAINSVEGTLLACWGAKHLEPWLILTDLPPENASAAWYGMRSWIENSFKDLKSDGWQWQNTRMSDPARAARLWLALAVASLWVVRPTTTTIAHQRQLEMPTDKGEETATLSEPRRADDRDQRPGEADHERTQQRQDPGTSGSQSKPAQPQDSTEV
jgi:hypothetical protein